MLQIGVKRWDYFIRYTAPIKPVHAGRTIICIFLKKRGCGYPVLAVEAPSPAALTSTNGAPDGPDGSGNADGGDETQD